MTIKYIALPGGGLDFFIFYGVLKHLNKEKVYDITTIEKIYGTSCGSILGLLLLLQLDWDTLDNYIINRPWNKLFDITPDILFNCIQNKGLLTIDSFNKFFDPLFKTVGYDLSITFKELFDKTNIEFNVFATKYDTLSLTIFNTHTHPDVPVLNACYMSSTLIPIFQPIIYADTYYIDGGVILNNPITYLLNTIDKKDYDKIISIVDISYCKKNKITNFNVDNINKDSDLISFILSLVLRLSNKVHDNLFDNKEDLKHIKHSININSILKHHNLKSWIECLENSSTRELYINKGVEYAELFLNYST